MQQWTEMTYKKNGISIFFSSFVLKSCTFIDLFIYLLICLFIYFIGILKEESEEKIN